MNTKNNTRLLIIGFFFFVLFMYKMSDVTAGNEQNNIKIELDRKIKLWREYLEANPLLSDLTGNKYYHDIIDLGMPALPYLIEKIEEGCWPLGDTVTVITKKRFEEYEQKEYQVRDSISTAKAVVKWWNQAKNDTNIKFKKLYSEKNSLKAKGHLKEAREKLENIRALGIAALPMIKDKVGLGDQELVPLVSMLTGGKVDPNASIQQCISWWEQNKEDWLIPFPNKRPVTKAGQDRTVTSGDTVQLDGSASSDADKDTLTYKWRQTAGLIVKLSDAQTAQPSFTAPQVEKETVLVFELVVNDGSPKKSVHPTSESGESDPNTVNITVKPKG
jgi:hypothetical protein